MYMYTSHLLGLYTINKHRLNVLHSFPLTTIGTADRGISIMYLCKCTAGTARCMYLVVTAKENSQRNTIECRILDEVIDILNVISEGLQQGVALRIFYGRMV